LTLIELVWTITPALILILIAFPSFKLLYLMDEVSDPAMSVLAEGFFETFNIYLSLYTPVKIYSNADVHKLAIYKENKNKSDFIAGFADASQKALVIWGTNLTSTVGVKFTLKQLSMVKLIPYTRDIIIGLLLSDGWLTFASKNTKKNARLGFKQSGAHGGYFWSVFWSLSHYCSSYPMLRIQTRFGKQTTELQFFTRSMPCLTKLHSLFYPNGVKIVPQNIYELLTPIALAHLIMGDGSVERHGLIICTDSYSIEDVIRLMNVLIIRYRLECTLRVRRKNQYRIYIRQSSMSIVTPYFHSSMLYKITSMSYKKSK